MRTLVPLLEGIALYLGWWLRALVAWRDPLAPVRGRRLLVLILGMPLFLAAQGIHGACLLLDELLFPAYRRVRIGRALFILGLPRSGTTFIHRTLAQDLEHYAAPATWEVLLAPAICQRKLVRAVAAVDRRLGGWGRRALQRAAQGGTGGLEAVHAVDLEAPEEDYLSLLPAGGCFLLILALPSAAGVRALMRFDDEMPEGRQRRLLDFYEACLQRHLYERGGERALLSKNAALSTWLRGLAERFPEARFLVAVRDPYRALSSQISAVRSAAAGMGVAVDTEAFEQVFLEHYAASLEHLEGQVAEGPLRQRAAVVDAADLHQRPGATLAAALEHIGDRPSASLQQLLDASDQRPRPRSPHQHDPAALQVTEPDIRTRLLPAYQGLRRVACQAPADEEVA